MGNISNRRQIEYGSIISYALLIVNIGLGLVYTPWMLKKVGDSNYGIYTLAVSVINFFLLDFGMSAAVTRFVAKYRAENNQKEIDRFISIAVKFYLILTIIIFFIMIAILMNLNTLYPKLTSDEMHIFKAVFAITAFFVVICFPGNVCNGILNAYEEYVALKGSEIFNKVITVGLTIAALLCHGGIISLVFINGLLNFVTLMFKLYLLRRRTPVAINMKRESVIRNTDIKEILSFSGWTTASALFQKMIFEFAPSILAMVADTFAITIFGFARLMESYVFNIINAINGFFIPEISRILLDEDDAQKILPLMIKVGRINQSIASILIMGLIFLGKDFVILWVGEEYDTLYACIIFVVIPHIILGSLQIANSSMVVLNKIKYTAYINLFTGLVNIMLVYICGNKYGGIGACASICLVSFMRIILYTYIYATKLNIDMKFFYKSCQMALLPANVFSGILIYIISRLFGTVTIGATGWLCLFAKSALSIVAYFTIMWLIGWNAFEKGLIKRIVCKFIGLKVV